jgi:hypothetical protein
LDALGQLRAGENLAIYKTVTLVFRPDTYVNAPQAIAQDGYHRVPDSPPIERAHAVVDGQIFQ